MKTSENEKAKRELDDFIRRYETWMMRLRKYGSYAGDDANEVLTGFSQKKSILKST